jgi:hypothetical protein
MHVRLCRQCMHVRMYVGLCMYGRMNMQIVYKFRYSKSIMASEEACMHGRVQNICIRSRHGHGHGLY